MENNYKRRILYSASGDAGLGMGEHERLDAESGLEVLQEESMRNLIAKYREQCDHRAQRLNPHGLDHTGDSGTYH